MVTSNFPRRSDFIISPYLPRSNKIASWQVLTTFLPIAGLWLLISKLNQANIPNGFKFLEFIPLLFALILFSSRAFSLMHDCGHGSLFRTMWLNRLMAFPLGVLNAVPQLNWELDHAFHHKHNGNWEIYRGPIDVITLQEYQSFSLRNKWLYKISRHWIMLFPGGFYYLIIKPRLVAILAISEFFAKSTSHILSDIGNYNLNRNLSLSKFLQSYKSNYWSKPCEFVDLLANNVAVIISWFFMTKWLGAETFWSCYSIIMTFSAAIFICIFFVQHNFEGSYANETDGWSSLRGALDGSSNLDLPRWLDWFFADISFHSIHHLCERIPNYRLRECHIKNQHLLDGIKILRLEDIPSCFGYILWDAKANQLTKASI